MAGTADTGYRIWAVDNVIYGPVEMPTLVSWIKDQRVTSDTWIFSDKDAGWQRAGKMPDFQLFFKARAIAALQESTASNDTAVYAKKPATLRRVKIFAEFSDEQLERFIRFMEVQRVRQWTEIVKQGQHGDAMYLVLEGELRVRMIIGGKESILVTLGAGEFFGEISLFDSGPRSADVIANQDSLLLKISADSFGTLIQEAPDIAAPFLFAMGRTLTARIRADNKRYRDSIAFARAAGK
jgi:CRP/FNR family transcriptional regulator, cyclic AMP receptor protein